jgi:hypothetical protein
MAAFSWTTGKSGDWNTIANWTPNLVPNDAAADVIIDALPTLGAYTVTIAAGASEVVNSLTMNATTNLNGSNATPYNAAQLELDGTLTFAPGSPGVLGGSLQTFIHTSFGSSASIVNVGTINGFIQVEGSLLVTGTNGFYVTNWLQALAGTVTVDTKSIAEMTGSILFDGIYEAKGPAALINLGGVRQGLVVNIATVEGPPLIPDGWTELILDGTDAKIQEWNGSAYVALETTLKDIASRGTVDVRSGRDYTTTNTLSIAAGGLLSLQAGTVTAAEIDINGGVVQGFATIAKGVVNNGTLMAVGGRLDVVGGLTGTGTVKFDFDQQLAKLNAVGATMEVHGVSAGQTFVMNGDDTLQLDTPATFAGTIAAKVGDKIVLQGVTATSAVDTNGVLVVSNGAQVVASLTLSGSFVGDSFNVSTVGGNTAISVSNGAPASANFTVLDTTTNATTTSAGDVYTGPVAGLQHQYINITADSLNITSTVPNAFLRSGSGTDGLNVSLANGDNVLDGSTGSNFLTGGTGNDTFYIDNRNPTSPIFSTIVNFHTGDNATVFGVNATDFKVLVLDNQGAAGFTGVDLIFTAPGRTDTSFVLAGYTSADLTNGRLSQSFGTTPDLPGLPGSQYLTIHAN